MLKRVAYTILFGREVRVTMTFICYYYFLILFLFSIRVLIYNVLVSGV